MYAHRKRKHTKLPLNKCDLCPKVYKGVEDLKKHKKLVHGSKKFILHCPVIGCDHEVIENRTHDIKRHVLSVHKQTEVAADECSFCPGQFHVHLKLNPENPIVCDFCDKVLGNKKSFVSHLRYSCKKNPPRIEALNIMVDFDIKEGQKILIKEVPLFSYYV